MLTIESTRMLTATEPIAVEPDCPLCGAAAERLFQKDMYWICRCGRCDGRFADIAVADDHVGSNYGDDYFQGGGAGYRDYLSEARILRAQGQRYGRLLKRFAPVSDLLDVGAAAGFLLQGFQDEGWRGEGLEPNDRMAAFAREQSGLAVRTASLETFPAERKYDAVSLIQVMAHFVDPRAALANVAELVRPGGVCLIETWNVASWTARLFGHSWHEYSPPSVLHWFTPQSLSRLMADFGFAEVARGRPQKWINAGHAASLLQYKLSRSGWTRWIGRMLGTLPENLALPYFGDDLFWAVYQKTESGSGV